MGNDALIFTADTPQEDITAWAGGLSLASGEPIPQTGDGNTVATVAVTPDQQQVLYLWEEGNARHRQNTPSTTAAIRMTRTSALISPATQCQKERRSKALCSSAPAAPFSSAVTSQKSRCGRSPQ